VRIQVARWRANSGLVGRIFAIASLTRLVTLRRARSLAASCCSSRIAVRVFVLYKGRGVFSGSMFNVGSMRTGREIQRGKIPSGIGDQQADVMHTHRVPHPEDRAFKRDRPVVPFLTEGVRAAGVRPSLSTPRGLSLLEEAE